MNEGLEHVLGNQVCQEVPTGLGEIRQEPRELRIFKVLNGYLVMCGCKTVVFENQGKMIAEIERYLNHPEQVEKEYLKTK